MSLPCGAPLPVHPTGSRDAENVDDVDAAARLCMQEPGRDPVEALRLAQTRIYILERILAYFLEARGSVSSISSTALAKCLHAALDNEDARQRESPIDTGIDR